MRSRATHRFWKLFDRLPEDVQQLAIKNYRLWLNDPSHPSLRFRPVQGSQDLFTIRVGNHYRVLGVLKEDLVIWVWIGTHAEYDRLLRS